MPDTKPTQDDSDFDIYDAIMNLPKKKPEPDPVLEFLMQNPPEAPKSDGKPIDKPSPEVLE